MVRLSQWKSVRVLFPTALAVALIAALSSPARADFELRISTDGATWTTYDYNTSTAGAAYGLNANGEKVIQVGSLFVPVTFGNFAVSIAAGSSNNIAGALNYGNIATVRLDSITIKNNGGSAGSLYLQVSDTGFNFPSPPLAIHDSASVTFNNSANVVGSSVTYQGFADAGNADFATTTPGIALTATVASMGALSPTFVPGNDATTAGIFSPAGNYSITGTFLFNLNSGASVQSGDAHTDVLTPEPGTLVMAIGAVPLLILGHRFRPRKQG